MKSWFACAALLAAWSQLAAAGLILERTIPLPGVEGRIDHFAPDMAGGRIFIAALGNNTVEVVDLKAGKVAHSITGLVEPQGIYYLAAMNRLYVANGGDGALRAFDGTTFAPVATVKFDDDADNVRYDATAKRLYVGHGRGALGAIDVATNKIVTDVLLHAHPESFQLEAGGPRAFVNMPNAHHIAVIDRAKNTVLATWSTGSAAANFAMALDEPHHRLMVACRVPPRLLVFDTESGNEVAKLDLHSDCDDLFYDPAQRLLYASCGEGYIDVFSQVDADHYVLMEAVRTVNRARTSFLDGEHLYLAVPKHDDQPAKVQCYRVARSGP